MFTTITVKGVDIGVTYAESPKNPRDNDNFSTLVTLEGADPFIGGEKIVRGDIGHYLAQVSLPVYATSSANGELCLRPYPFPSKVTHSLVGIIYTTNETIKSHFNVDEVSIGAREMAYKCLLRAIEEYMHYLNRDVFTYSLSRGGKILYKSSEQFYGEDYIKSGLYGDALVNMGDYE